MIYIDYIITMILLSMASKKKLAIKKQLKGILFIKMAKPPVIRYFSTFSHKTINRYRTLKIIEKKGRKTHIGYTDPGL